MGKDKQQNQQQPNAQERTRFNFGWNQIKATAIRIAPATEKVVVSGLIASISTFCYYKSKTEIDNNRYEIDRNLIDHKDEIDRSFVDYQTKNIKEIIHEWSKANGKGNGGSFSSPFDSFDFTYFFYSPFLLFTSFTLYFLSLSSLFFNLHEFLLTKFLPSSTILKISSS